MAEDKKGLLGRLGFGRKKKAAETPAPAAPAPTPIEAPKELTPAERALEEARALAREREAQGIDAVEQARRLAQERAERDRIEAEAKVEADRLAAEKAEAAREAAEAKAQAEADAKVEAEKLAQEKAQAEREAAQAKAKAEEGAKAKAEALAAEKEAAARAEADRIAAEEADAKRIADEKAAAKAEAAKAAKARKAAEAKAAEEAAEAERLEADRREAERLAQVEAEKAEAARIAKAKAEKQEADRLAKEKAKSEKEARERAKREKAKAEKLAAEQAKREAEAKSSPPPASPPPEPGLRAEEADVSDDLPRPRVEPFDAGDGDAEDVDASSPDEIAARKADREAREAAERDRLKAEAQAKLDAAKAKAAAPRPAPLDPDREGGLLARMSKGLKRSSSKLSDNVVGAFQKRLLDDEALEDLEDMLIASDLGVKPSLAIVERLQDQRFNTTVDDSEVRAAMAEVVTETLAPYEKHLKLNHEPGSGNVEVVLFTGVNGSGKTTTLGKLAAIFRDAGYTILIAAADTFRAAANEQLAVWAERAEAPIMEGKQGADAAGLVFDAMKRAKEDGYDILMVDTAGRLQNRTELMDELEKIVRVIKKQDADAPHHSLLVLDATVGQNALSQVEVFKETADVTGLVMTKLDGTAKGGVLVNLTDTHKLPIHFVGIGERLEDLETFDAKAYATALSGSIAG